MAYHLLADLTLIAHLLFILFVAFGGLLVLVWRGVLWLHLPALVWGLLLELNGWLCPLTPLENWLRRQAGSSGYRQGFIEHYLVPLVYPAGLDRRAQLILAGLLLLANALIYGWVYRLHRRRSA